MAANITTTTVPAQNFQNTGRQFLPLNQLPKGSGEVGRYLTDVTGILVGIEPRGGSYQVKDRRTGQMITRPNSWTAYFADGNMFSWPTYVDPATGQVMPWSRFDKSIDLAQIIQQQVVIHLWKDDRQFTHLEVVGAQTLTPANAQPTMAQAQPDVPWYYEN